MANCVKGARFPEATYPSLKTLLGRTAESDVVQRFLEQHPTNELVQSNRSTLTFQHGDSTHTVEELVAMQLVNIKSQAEQMAEEKIKELVPTVPAFWTEQERKTIVDAAELAGMRVSTLIQDGLAGINARKKLVESSCDQLWNNEDFLRGTTISSNLRYGSGINNCNGRLVQFKDS